MDVKGWCHFLTLKILLLLCSYEAVLSEITCTPGLQMPGYTIPQGDIVIEEGSDLDIMCVVVNDTHNNASLSFQRNSEPIPSENILVINSTSIKLHYPSPPLASGDTYTCLLNNESSVCMNRVTVGKKPQKVTNFACIAYNFDNLTCTWTAPENYVRTEYALNFTLGEGRSSRLPFTCPEIRSVGRNMSCFWNVSTTPPYRQVHKSYNFTLTMRNKFGDNQINEDFQHWAHVLSGPPENLTAISTSPSTISLYWVVPLSMQTFPPGVHHRILYQCVLAGKQWHDGGLLTDPKAPRKYAFHNITNIPYAHDLCDIRVSLRSAQAQPHDESMWSFNASTTVRTRSKIPDEPPETNIGGFEVQSTSTYEMEYQNVIIYWKQIPEVKKNGRDFEYRVKMEGNDSAKPGEITNTYAKFLNLLNRRSYTFHVWSVNSNGSSIDKSTIYVPKQSDRLKEPVTFTKVELSEGEYELAWEAPKLLPDQIITNYTIFTCINERDRPYQCNGVINWTVVPSDKTAINISVDSKVNQIAISTNTHNSSSGMFWAECTIIRNKSVGKLKNVWVNKIGANFMELGWKLDCSDNIGSVKNYIVYYCPIISPLSRQCKGPQLNMSFEGITSGGNITNLYSYTTYMMSVAALTKHTTYSQQSEPLFNTTLETAPSVPRNLRVDNVTNSTVLIVWDEPEKKNGLLRFYKVRMERGGWELVHTPVEVEHQTNYTWEDLLSYENYTIGVSACTHDCSLEVKVNVKTKMGYPNKISKPMVDRRNDTTITIVWPKPSKPGGNLDHYTVRLKQKHGNRNHSFEFNTTALKYVIENCGDNGKFNTFYVSVRAVNKNEVREYSGEWSDELENYCDTPFNYILYISLAAVLVVLISIGFASNRLYHRCKIMRDVEVKLPPGLAPVVADHTLVPWSTEKHQENHHDPHSPPDEELLLVKMSERRHCSGDSSGCSSGHESVTSSLESGTHISSSSDSGTEQPVDYLTLAVDPKLGSPYIAVTAESDDMGYQACDLSGESTPYVLGGEAVKRTNPGYVPYNPPEPIAKSTGYVVAGLKNVNGYIPFGQTEAASRNAGYVVAGIKNCKLD